MQEVSRAVGGPGQGPREKELGSHLSQRGVCAVLTLHKPRFPAGSALVQGSLENEKRPGVKAEEDAVGPVPPSFPPPLLQAWPKPRGTSFREGGETKKVTADVRDMRVGGEHDLTYISPSSTPSPYSSGPLFWMAPSSHTQAGHPPLQRRPPLGRYMLVI